MAEIVVTGTGAVTSLGDDVESTWTNLISGASGVGHITHFDASQYEKVPDIAAEVESDPSEWSVVNPRRMGRYTQLAIKAADEALGSANLDPTASEHDSTVVGTSIANSMGGVPELHEYSRSIANGEWVSPRAFLQVLPNLASGYVSIEFDATGPNRASAAACAAGSQSIADAVTDLRAGRADVMIAGGTEAIVTPLIFGLFGGLGGLSKNAEDPTSACRPFDVDRNGTVFGEGSAVLVLETREHAQERGATPLATISGFGMRSDAFHPTKPRKDAEGLTESMRRALADAGREPQEIDHVSSHATGTPIGDEREAKAIRNVFDECPPVTSLKSSIGHLLGGSGAVGAVTAVQSIREGAIPPTVGCENRDEACDIPVVTETAEETVSKVVTNAVGFGGTNCSLVIERA